MNRTIRINLWRSLTLVLLVSLVLPWTAFAAVWTDKLDYSPGETVTILGDNSDGAGYLPTETVHVDVVGPNDYTAMCDGVAADTSNADWSCQVTLWDSDLAVGTYYYTATGQYSGVVQEGTFTDGSYNPKIGPYDESCTGSEIDTFLLGEEPGEEPQDPDVLTVCAKVTGVKGYSTATVKWWGPHGATHEETVGLVNGNGQYKWQPFALGPWTIELWVSDKVNAQATATFDVIPDVTIESPADYAPIPITTPVSVVFSWTDTGEDEFVCTAQWSEYGPWETLNDCTSLETTATHDYTSVGAGLYKITIKVVENAHQVAGVASITVVVYDPDAGFVTGGGWFYSEPTWYQKPGQVVETGGEATFGFVSKFYRGATVPEGETEFQFHRADFSFRSDTYDWLVVNKDGTNAQYQGEGTVDGETDVVYNFMLWATDGDNADPETFDTFRIKIWDPSNPANPPIYDNVNPTRIDGGTIIIHTNGK